MGKNPQLHRLGPCYKQQVTQTVLQHGRSGSAVMKIERQCK